MSGSPVFREPRSASTVAVVAAFAAVYLIWGSTYLAIRYAVETIPPFLMMGVRSFVAGCVLLGIGSLRTGRLPARGEWAFAAVVGGFMFLGGHGALAWAELRVPSGSAALVIATVPVWLVVLDWMRARGRRPLASELASLGLGLVGVMVLIVPVRRDGPVAVDALGIAALVFAAISWSVGSLFSRHDRLPSSALLRTGTALVTGGAALLVVSALLAEWGRLDPEAISLRSLLSLGYLILFGSLVAFTSYLWLLRVVTPARVGTYAFVNPIIAVVIGWGVGGEALTPRLLAAAVLILAGVWLVNVHEPKRKRATGSTTDLTPRREEWPRADKASDQLDRHSNHDPRRTLVQRNVARMWEGIVSTEDADAYHAYLRETGLADYASTPGYVEGFVLRRDDPDASRTSFLLLTFWESWDAIRAFAGEEIERAKYYPDDDEYLLSMTETVEHFEVVENFDPRPPASGPGAPRPTGGGR